MGLTEKYLHPDNVYSVFGRQKMNKKVIQIFAFQKNRKMLQM